jgi:energy-converting hydrogenase Eha subunit E
MLLQEQNQFIVVLVCKLEYNKNMATITFVASQLNLSKQLINITLPKENFDAPR